MELFVVTFILLWDMRPVHTNKLTLEGKEKKENEVQTIGEMYRNLTRIQDLIR